ncbi:MAG: hypothetical protein ACSLFR_13860 [Solirubrobacteraceae bacterium]
MRLAACTVGDALGLDDDELAGLHQAALLRAIGCTAHAAENAELFDDDLAFQRDMHEVDVADPSSLDRFGCEASRSLGAALTLRPGAIAALDEVDERYDGLGIPDGRAGDALTITARVTHAAEQAVIAYDAGG